MSDTENTPTEEECLKRIKASFDGLEGQERDYEEAARWAQRGHGLGYVNCTIELADCYEGGYGVPRDYARVLELARELEAKGCPVAWRFFATAYAEGHGVPLDHAKAQEYAQKLQKALARPVPGLDEDQRRESLLAVYVIHNSVGGSAKVEEYMAAAREHLRDSAHPDRFALYASALLYRLAEAEEGELDAEGLLDEVMGALAEGVSQENALCMYLMATVIPMRDDPSAHKFVPQLLLMASKAGQPAVFGDLLRMGELPGDYASLCNDNFWQACNLGVSQLPREGALPCELRLLYSPFAVSWKVHAEPGRDVQPLTTRLALFNEGEEALADLRLRLCSADAGVDATVELAEGIEAEGVLELDLAEYERKVGKPFGKEFYAELHSGGRSCDMALDHSEGLDYFYHRDSGSELPLELWWERSFWGGRVLCARCTGGSLHGFWLARRANGAVTRRRTLQAGETVRFGRPAFRSLRGLRAGDELSLSCDELPRPLWLEIAD